MINLHNDFSSLSARRRRLLLLFAGVIVAALGLGTLLAPGAAWYIPAGALLGTTAVLLLVNEYDGLNQLTTG